MTPTYFDTVLDDEVQPLFTGNPDEVKEFLRTHDLSEGCSVYVGMTSNTKSVQGYLKSS